MKKNYLLDTNILLENPNAIFGFGDNNLYLCGITLQEIDAKKTAPGELGYNARTAARILDDLRQKGSLTGGVQINDEGGKLFLETQGINEAYLPKGFSIDRPDNKILSACLYINSYLGENPIILLTNDISMRVNASVCGIQVQGVINDHISDETARYTGVRVENTDSDTFSRLSHNKVVYLDKNLYPWARDLMPNEFVTLQCDGDAILSVYQGGALTKITVPEAIGRVTPLNAEQAYAMWALANPDIPLVILDGPAGTAKSFLSLVMGLTQTRIDEQDRDALYTRMMIARPNTGSSDKDFGYLPGDLLDKMSPMIANFTDNLSIILRGKYKNVPETEVRSHIDDMISQGIIELTPLYGIRGRSIQRGFLICDEAQNASKLLVRDVITRAGTGTKIVIAGDPDQVDNPTLDKRNNGLVYAEEKMKGSPLCAIIKFSEQNCVRSQLAEDAIKRM